MRKLLKYVGFILLNIIFLLVGAYFYFVYAPAPKEPKLSAVIQNSSLNIGDRERSYAYYLPSNLPDNAPLVLVLHGAMQNANGIRSISAFEFERLADKHGFALVYPNGFENHWNDCRKLAPYSAKKLNIDDKGFISTLIDKFQIDFKTDSERVFVVGYSNGGQLAYRLALETPDKIDGIAVIGANLPAKENSDCQEAKQTIPAMIINGTADPINPHNGGDAKFLFRSLGTVLSSNQTAEYFAQINEQTEKPTISQLPLQEQSDTTSVQKTSYQSPNKSEVVLYTIEGGGHVVPQPTYENSRMLGKTTKSLNAPAEIWNFFSTISKKSD
ncbi:MAG: alpha/beta fold hydrolase [Acidobacteriota bacterium]